MDYGALLLVALFMTNFFWRPSWPTSPVSIRKRAVWPIVSAEAIAVLVEGGGKQRHWCRNSNSPKRSGLHGIVGLFFYSTYVIGLVQRVLTRFHRWGCLCCKNGGLVPEGYP